MLPKAGLTLLAVALTSVGLAAQSGTLTTLADFEQQDGSGRGLIQASDGNFYGLSGSDVGDDVGESASAAYGGAIFRLTSSGKITVLHYFCQATGCPAGVDPMGPLVEGPDGNLYGVTLEGGNYEGSASTGCPLGEGCGTVFKISLAGQFTTLYAFCANGSGEDCPDGYGPEAGLTLGADGKLYGTNTGIIFRISTTGALTTLYSGLSPDAMVQATDGNFYGISSGAETVFRFTPGGKYSTVYSFPTEEFGGGDYPYASTLVQGPDGRLYGTTAALGLSNCDSSGCGSLFALSLAGRYSTLYQFCGLANCADGAYPNGPIAFTGPTNVIGTTGGTDYDSDDHYGSIFQYNAQSGLSPLYDFTDSSDGAGPTGLVLASNGELYGTTVYGGDDSCQVDPSLVGCGTAFRYDAATPFAAPVQVSLSSSQVQPGAPVTATLKVLNAFSLTLQQCYAFETLDGTTTPLGKVPGTYNSSTTLYTFSGTIPAPARAGIYNYAVTCGGVESGFASLTVGDTTSTTLAAMPNPVTPPANVTLTATVKRATGSGTPTGQVKFSVGTTVLGSAKLNGSGVATFSAGSQGIAAGTYPVVATYSGDSEDVSSTSAAVNIKVQ